MAMAARIGLLTALVLPLAGCVAPRQAAPPPPAPAPAPPPSPTPAPVPDDWRDRAYTPGDWSYVQAGPGSEARYGAPASPHLILRCQGGAMALELPGVASGPVTVRTTYGDTARTTQPVGTALRLSMAARDPLLDQIAYSRGRFMVIAGGRELILPAWPEVARVIEDCR